MNEPPTQRLLQNENQRWEIVLLVSSLLAGLAFGVAAYREVVLAPWRAHQRQYRAMLIANAVDERGRHAAETFQIRYYQYYLPALGRIDRCVTCHIGIDDPAMKDVPQPLTTHPGDLLEYHPADRFGCTICHGGQGRGTEAREAHGGEPGRPAPMRRGEMLQVTCAKCHSEPELPDVPVYNLSQQLFTSKGCLACHELRGSGPTLPVPAMHGPELTGQSGKHPLTWHVQHFLDPKKIVPNSKMPNFQFTEAEASALAHLMLSFDSESLSNSFLPGPKTPGTMGRAAERLSLTPEHLGAEVDPQAAPGYVGSQTCLKCHASLHPGLPDVWQTSKMGHHAYAAVHDVPDNKVCLPCHSTGYNPATSVFVEPNVGCEACHGPGREYVSFVLAGKLEQHKAAARTNVLRNDCCVDCHRAPHVAKENHADHMRFLARKQALDPAGTTGHDIQLPAFTSENYLTPRTAGLDQLPSLDVDRLTSVPPVTPNDFGVIGADQAAPGHVGSQACLFCHQTLHPDVVHHWQYSKKAHAFEAVRDVANRELCLPCHATGYNAQTNLYVEQNVGCEACHGPGQDYVAPLVVGKSAEHARLAREMGATNACVSCHQVHISREKHVETIRSGKQNTIDMWKSNRSD